MCLAVWTQYLIHKVCDSSEKAESEFMNAGNYANKYQVLNKS